MAEIFLQITDHKPLTAILGLKKGMPFLAAARLQRWTVCLSTYQYDITFKPTGEHANADGLPLRLTKPAANHHATNKISAFNQAQIDTLPLTASQIAKATNGHGIETAETLFPPSKRNKGGERMCKAHFMNSRDL